MDTTTSTWRLTLSVEEIYYLCCLLQVTGLIGLEDPFLGLFTEEIDERLVAARDSLILRGCLTKQTDGSLAIGAPVVGIVAAITLADDVVVATIGEAGRDVSRFFHTRPDTLVEQETLPSGEVAFTVVPKKKILAQRLLHFASPTASGSAPGSAFTIRAGDLEEARNLARQTSSDNCRNLLERAGVPKEAALSLANCLTTGATSGSVALLHRSRAAITYGESLAWLVGPGGAWQVTSQVGSGEPTIHMVPRASIQITRRIATLASNLIEETLSMRQR